MIYHANPNQPDRPLLGYSDHAIYRLRKCNVEPVIGILKDVLGFRQSSLLDLRAAVGEWCLV